MSIKYWSIFTTTFFSLLALITYFGNFIGFILYSPWLVFFIALSLYIVGLGVVSEHANKDLNLEYLLKARKVANELFEKISIISSDAKFVFSGVNLSIVDEIERVGSHGVDFARIYFLTRYARNSYGEYCCFKIEIELNYKLEACIPYINYIDQKMAKFLLKEKYVSPPSFA